MLSASDGTLSLPKMDPREGRAGNTTTQTQTGSPDSELQSHCGHVLGVRTVMRVEPCLRSCAEVVMEESDLMFPGQEVQLHTEPAERL